MSNTIHGYLAEYGGIPFTDVPMNDVDSLVLCQFAYLKFDGMVPGVYEDKRSVTLKELAGHPDMEKLFKDEMYEEDNRKLFEGMLSSRRFQNIKINCHINVVEKERETQFCAVTIILDDNTIYVAFRGTDESIVGWKECFNMAFLMPFPGQELSAKYLNMVTKRFSSEFYVGGHSKGGNLAIYAAMNCAPVVQKRIRQIYCMDGPGLHPESYKKCDYEKIADKVIKIKPQSSLVGMIFDRDSKYKVIDARYFGLAQHNPFNWLVKDGEFVEVAGIYKRASYQSNTLNEWIISQDEEHIRLFVDTLYQVISASEADDVRGITSNWKKSASKMIEAMKEVDKETVDILQKVVEDLIDLSRTQRRERMHSSLRKFIWKRGLAGRAKSKVHP